MAAGRAIQHGHNLRGKRTKFFSKWACMKQRCSPRASGDDKKNYFERNIIVCDSWKQFVNFRDDMYASYLEHVKEFGEKETTLDRIDNDKGYSKENCRWATHSEQMNNRRKFFMINTKRKIPFNGECMNLAGWARKMGLKRSTLAQRYYVYKWDIEKTLTYKKPSFV